MGLPFKIAVRFLRSSKIQTLMIVLGIGIGVSVQIFIGSLITGLQNSLIDTTVGNSSQITVSPKEKGGVISNYTKWITEIQNSDKKIEHIVPVLTSPAFLQQESSSDSLLLKGMDLTKAEGIYDITNRLTSGKIPKNMNEVILGKSLQKEYNLKKDQTVEILLPSGETKQMKITGFFDFKVSAINDAWAITNLSTAQQYLNKDNEVTSIEMQVPKTEIFQADTIAEKLVKDLNAKDFQITNWKAENESLLSGLNGQSVSSYMIQVFVLVSVVLGIASVLAITVMQKSKQVGILKAMGMRDAITSLVFLTEGFLLGIFGAIAGILFGIGLLYSFSTFALNPDKTPIVPVTLDVKFILLFGCIAIISCLFASLIPALKSKSLNPIDIIKNN